MSLSQRTEVVIIGGGPTGLTTSLLLSGYGVEHLLVEQGRTGRRSPVAHFISARSMEIFRQVPGLAPAIDAAGKPLEEWRRHVYCTDLYHLPETATDGDAPQGSLLGVRDHFPHGRDTKVSPARACHLAQDLLLGLLRDALEKHPQGQLIEGYRAEVHEGREGVEVDLISADGKQAQRVRCRYAICADGAHGTNREALGIGRSRDTSTRQDFINIHFFSPQLRDILTRRIMGELYFIYAASGIGILAGHDHKTGEYLLQLPFFPTHQPPNGFTKPICARIIDRLAGTPVAADIRSVRPWRQGAWVAERFHSPGGRCFILGDAAHQFLPTGGFGLNCGIADSHNLAWKLAIALKEGDVPGDRGEALLKSYTAERRPLAEAYLEISRGHFKQATAVASALGLDWRAARWLDALLWLLPAPGFVGRRLFGLGMRLALSQVDLLKGDSFVGKIRRKRLKRLLNAPHRNLGSPSAHQNLGARYDRGWLEEAVDGEAAQGEDDARNPTLSIGGRLPHFWLRPSRGDTQTPISSLDLPGLLVNDRRQPAHLMLLVDLTKKLGRQLTRLRASRYGEMEMVRIAISAAEAHKADYLLLDDRGGFSPARGAILLRPDGHVAWTW